MAGVTDGTSNTMLASERAHGKFNTSDITGWNWWTSGNFGDTLFTTFYPMNPFNKIVDFCCLDSGPDAYVAVPSSFHPGGANFGFADGSVKFLKDSISSWQIQGAARPRTPASWQRASREAVFRLASHVMRAGVGSSWRPNTYLGVCQAVNSQRQRGRELRPILSESGFVDRVQKVSERRESQGNNRNAFCSWLSSRHTGTEFPVLPADGLGRIGSVFASGSSIAMTRGGQGTPAGKPLVQAAYAK